MGQKEGQDNAPAAFILNVVGRWLAAAVFFNYNYFGGTKAPPYGFVKILELNKIKFDAPHERLRVILNAERARHVKDLFCGAKFTLNTKAFPPLHIESGCAA